MSFHPEESSLISDADFALLGVAAEVIADVTLATRDAERGAAIDEVLSALGKRAKRPVLSVDSKLKEAMVWIAVGMAYRTRGVEQIDRDTLNENLKRIDDWLELVATGRREPQFVDSSTSVDEMGSLAGTSSTSTAWAAGPFGLCAPRRCGCK